ncbi:MAG: four helix bundle protein [Planctomycetes bacterium]|nr:four helix bundle protein [Planctomycetota bacterium]
MNRAHKKLAVWQGAVHLATQLYKQTESFPDSEKFGLVSQLRRAGVSVPSNIAEGAARNSDRDFLRFLNMANGSLSEIDTQLEIARQLNYLHPDEVASIEDLVNSVSIKLAGLIRHLKQKRGEK